MQATSPLTMADVDTDADYIARYRGRSIDGYFAESDFPFALRTSICSIDGITLLDTAF